MDVPTTTAGVVKEIALAVGAKVKTGDLVVVLEAEEAEAQEDAPAELAEESAPESTEESPAVSEPPVTPAPAAAPPVTLPDADVQAEVLVLGAGPGGYTAAFRAADLGKRVVIVEKHATLGGVCLNVGCIPSKALLHVGQVVEEASDLSKHGVTFGEPEIDLEGLRGFKDGVVSRLTKGLAAMAKDTPSSLPARGWCVFPAFHGTTRG
jgi:dihydrolipoamide dehydrogenase